MLENKKRYILVMSVEAEPMTRAEYNSTQECFNAEKKNLSEVGYSVACNGDTQFLTTQFLTTQFLTKEQFDKYCHEIGNLKFSGAVGWLKLGFTVARHEWKNGCIKLSKDGLCIVDNNNNKYYPTLNDLAAEDWQILE